MAFIPVMTSRQVVYFLCGTLLGCLIPQLLLTSEVLETRVVMQPGAATGPGSLSKLPVHSVDARLATVQPGGQTFNLDQRPKRTRSHKIMRWARGEVSMAELVQPFLLWTSDDMTRAMARTWLPDAAKLATIYAPEESVAATIRQFDEFEQAKENGFSTAGQIKSLERWSSGAGGMLLTMAALCQDYLDTPAPNKPILSQSRWFLFGYDHTYVRMDALRKFLRTVSLEVPLCVARPHTPGSDRETASWFSHFGYLLNQKAMSSACPLLPECKNLMGKMGVDDETVLSRCLATAGVRCTLAEDVSYRSKANLHAR